MPSMHVFSQNINVTCLIARRWFRYLPGSGYQVPGYRLRGHDTNSLYQSIRPPCGFLPRLPGRTLRPSFVSTIAMNSAPPSGRPFGLMVSNPSSAACSPGDSSKRSAKRGARSSAGPTSTSASSRPLKMRA